MFEKSLEFSDPRVFSFDRIPKVLYHNCAAIETKWHETLLTCAVTRFCLMWSDCEGGLQMLLEEMLSSRVTSKYGDYKRLSMNHPKHRPHAEERTCVCCLLRKRRYVNVERLGITEQWPGSFGWKPALRAGVSGFSLMRSRKHKGCIGRNKWRSVVRSRRLTENNSNSAYLETNRNRHGPAPRATSSARAKHVEQVNRSCAVTSHERVS